MSDRASDWAWSQTGLAPIVRLALLAFAREADEAGRFVLRRKELAALLECSVDTVDRRIKALEEAELLRVDRDPKGGGFKASRYALRIPKDFVAASRNPAASVVDITEERSRRSAASTNRKPAASHGRNLAASVAADLPPPEAAPVAASIRDSLDTPSTEEEFYPDRPEASGTVAVVELTLTAPDMQRKRKRKSQFNPTWELGEKGRAFAREEGFLNGSADALFARFKDHHLANGSLMADWEAAWRKWVRNELKFNPQRKPYDNAASPATPDIRREKVSAATAQRERDRLRLEAEARNRAIDLGRVESVRIE